MRLFYLVFILSFASPMCFAGWKAVVADQLATEYVNLQTAQRENNIVKMWNMTDFKMPQEVGNGLLFKSSKSLQEYDCVNQKKRTVSLIHYSENMGEGKVTYFDASQDDWRLIAPNSLGEVYFKAAC